MLGVVASQLIANLAKHTFAEGDGGTITVRLHPGAQADMVGLTIADDGRDMPPPEVQGSDLDLVRRLLRQAGGKLSRDTTGHGAWTMALKA